MCIVPDCQRPMLSRGLCSSHYVCRWQWLHRQSTQSGSPFIFLGRVYKNTKFVCRLAQCGQGHGRLFAKGRCRRCYYRLAAENPEFVQRRRESSRRSAAKNQNRFTRRRAHLRKKYGLSIEQFEAMVAAQGGTCGICPTPIGHSWKTNVDHDHETGAIRGLLCRRCNRALGLLKDDERWLANAITYLHGAS